MSSHKLVTCASEISFSMFFNCDLNLPEFAVSSAASVSVGVVASGYDVTFIHRFCSEHFKEMRSVVFSIKVEILFIDVIKFMWHDLVVLHQKLTFNCNHV